MTTDDKREQQQPGDGDRRVGPERPDGRNDRRHRRQQHRPHERQQAHAGHGVGRPAQRRHRHCHHRQHSCHTRRHHHQKAENGHQLLRHVFGGRRLACRHIRHATSRRLQFNGYGK